ncbi:hypothetical protein HGP17_10145 [Rhizobium sp. P38BS-XIX]|uniref:hypothetical protein n=1 Tax=Rhizobium sp. P38BS-XIX TaxID=2726740 RepID=UPI00145706BD|nr:hypothetical protein [Rhizobium sp. P38BS-XIX]NLR97194.1 hypothetical protein [Rhizobium sp. P38BS-XIX]
MHECCKSFEDMTLKERSTLLKTVADALEATADEAEEVGDLRFAANSMCIAHTIRGMVNNSAERDNTAAEVLLEQGIVLVHQFSSRQQRRLN